MRVFSLNSKVLAAYVQAEHIGAEQIITSVRPSHNVCTGGLSFIYKANDLTPAPEQKPVLLVKHTLKHTFNDNKLINATLLYVTNPRLAFAQATHLLHAQSIERKSGIHPTALIGKNCSIDNSASIAPYVVLGDCVQIAADTQIGAQSVIGNGVIIGTNSVIHPRVSLYDSVQIGDRCIVHSGATIGVDGFGFEADSTGAWHKLHHFGRVLIEDDVEIGANTTIDRGTTGDTLVQAGTKIDNLVQIAHNVHIGQSVAIAGQSGIAGSTKIGAHSMLGAQTGVADVDLPKHTIVLGKTGITAHSAPIQPNTPYSSLLIARPAKEWYRMNILFKKLSYLFAQVKQLVANRN